jgi:hypothetical protein
MQCGIESGSASSDWTYLDKRSCCRESKERTTDCFSVEPNLELGIRNQGNKYHFRVRLHNQNICKKSYICTMLSIHRIAALKFGILCLGRHIYYLLQPSKSHPDSTSGFEIKLYLGKSDILDDFSSSFFVQPGTRNVISMMMEARRTFVKKRAISFSPTTLPCEKPFEYVKASESSITQKQAASHKKLYF